MLVEYFKYQVKFKIILSSQSKHYQGKILMHTIGSDFTFENANVIFKNFDKLMNYINQNQDKFNMEIFYSTPTKYIDELNRQ